jgi:putative heme-binding domain-containing protein
MPTSIEVFRSRIRRYSCSRAARVCCFASLLTLLGSPAWAQRNLKEIPPPDPVAEIAAMTPDPAASVNLFAADPDIRKPIQMNFDSRGRLWVASSEAYPQIKPGEKANDKIVVLEDTDGDGVSDKSIVFADGLLIPTGVIPDGKGGAYVAASTELLHFSDTDGDGKADVRRVVLSGFGTEDTHHLVHTLRWGPDGCLYFNQSIYIHSHIETPYGTRHLEGGGIWRYRPETGELSVLCKGFVNPWGHIFDAVGESFATDGAYMEGINYVFPGAVFVTAPGETRFVKGMNPGSPKHCGLEILSGSHIPPDWVGDLVTNDFRGHRVCRFTLSPQQSTYASRQQREIVTSKHIAFRPIDARMGPDGTLFLADWYNPIIQHGEVDFRDDRRDREHGRIWRVSFPGRELDPWPDFATRSRDELISLLESPSLAVRQFAREHLWPMVRTEADQVLSAVKAWRDAAPDEKTRLSRALEQQWLGEVAGRFEADAFEFIASAAPSEFTRTSLRSASRVAPVGDSRVSQVAMKLARGEHGPSQLEAVIVLGQMNDQSSAEALLKTAQAAGAPQIADPMLDFVLWQALRASRSQWTAALREGKLDWKSVPDGLALAVSSAATPEAASLLLDIMREGQPDAGARKVFASAIANSGDAGSLGALLEIACESLGDESFATIVSTLVARTQRDRTVPRDADRILGSRFGQFESLPSQAAAAVAVVNAMGQWRASSGLPLLVSVLEKSEQPAVRLAAIGSLGMFDDADAKAALLRIANSDRGAETVAAIGAIASKQPRDAAKLAASLVSSMKDDQSAGSLMAAMVANKEAAKALPELIVKQTFTPERAKVLLAAIRGQGGNADVEASLEAASKLEGAGWKLTPELSERLLAEVASHGDAAEGEKIYRRNDLQCIQCHAIGPAGGLVGPNLISLGASSQPDYVLESLLDPNARLKEGYNTLAVLTDDGRVTSGIPIGRDEKSLQLRLADGKEVVIPQEAIEEEQPGKSLMPAGLVDKLSQKELVDLTAFLASLGKVGRYTVSTEPYVRSLETLVYSDEALARLNRTSIDTAAKDDPALTWRSLTTLVNATLPLGELDTFKPHRDTPASSYVRFDVTAAEGETVTVKMPIEGVNIWLDGTPVPPGEFVAMKLSPGTHRVVVGIERDRFKGDWSATLSR